MEKKQILLISGPTGAGKSTFLSCLESAKLDQQILKALPHGAADWSAAELNDILKGSLSSEECLTKLENERCGKFHYDITFIHSRGIANYEDDPSLKILQQADSLWVIFIKPNYETVRRQYNERRAQKLSKKSKISLLWARYGRKNLRRLKRILKSDTKRELGDPYSNEQLLIESYVMWHNYLKTLCASVEDLKITILHPNSKSDDTPYFHILK